MTGEGGREDRKEGRRREDGRQGGTEGGDGSILSLSLLFCFSDDNLNIAGMFCSCTH